MKIDEEILAFNNLQVEANTTAVAPVSDVDLLSKYFHRLFFVPYNSKKKKSEWKKGQKMRRKEKEELFETYFDNLINPCPTFQYTMQIPGNPTALSVYNMVHLALLGCVRGKKRSIAQAILGDVNSDNSEGETIQNDENPSKVPIAVIMGLNTIFEIITLIRKIDPNLSVEALKALLDVLQHQQPESLKNEQREVFDHLFDILLQLSTSKDIDNTKLVSVATSCLLSLVIAKGDTGKLISATTAILMDEERNLNINIPEILTALQRSVHSVIMGKNPKPDWCTVGVSEDCFLDVVCPQDIYLPSAFPHWYLACDGVYLFLIVEGRLTKFGTGFEGTREGHIYATNEDFWDKDDGYIWIGCVKEKLYLCSIKNKKLYEVDKNTLILSESNDYFDTSLLEWGALFTDGENICQLIAPKNKEGFYVKNISCANSTEKMHLNLTRKCLQGFGYGGGLIEERFAEGAVIAVSTSASEDEVIGITCGKDFGLIKTANGKVLYCGRGTNLGVKPTINVEVNEASQLSTTRWNELTVPKAPFISLVSAGHEGFHAILVGADGSVYFTGTSRRGEDGEQSKAARRLQKPTKPKRIARMESHCVIDAACNNGSTALVTKEGLLYMFGKDTIHCDSTGLVSCLKDVSVRRVALGKAHAVVLTDTGRVYTFGINNKGQCGRECPITHKESGNITAMETNVDDTETIVDDIPDDLPVMCPPDKHIWKQSYCKICVFCMECTGYASSCLSSINPGRTAGGRCGCGGGDAGCGVCGACRLCANEAAPEGQQGEAAAIQAVYGDNRGMERDEKNIEKRQILIPKRKCGINPLKALSVRMKKPELAYPADEPSSSDIERDASRVTLLSPAPVDIPSKSPAIDIACGLHHTLVLLECGKVYAFGSNAFGQLGVSDTNPRFGPTLVDIKSKVIQIAAGSNHSVFLTSHGRVLTCGAFQKKQLGRVSQNSEEPPVKCRKKLKAKEKTKDLWHSVPWQIPDIGPEFSKQATGIGASGDMTFVQMVESLIIGESLYLYSIVANKNSIGFFPHIPEYNTPFRSLIINKNDGSCNSFVRNQIDFEGCAMTLDSRYNLLWSIFPDTADLLCFNPNLSAVHPTFKDIFENMKALPVVANASVSRNQAAVHLLSCIDILARVSPSSRPRRGVDAIVKKSNAPLPSTTNRAKVYSCEDFSTVNRFESYGGGWGYSGHSIEAIRFMADSDLLIGGFGLFGGRGEYRGKVKLYDIGFEGGEQEVEGELLAESDDVPFECAPRQRYPMLFDEPVPIQANRWYIAWARICGPSSDCGSNGQGMVTTEDNVVFCFKSSRRANNGSDVNGGQIPQILYRIIVPDNQLALLDSSDQETIYHLSKAFSRNVNKECFESLLKFLEWSWNCCKKIVEDYEDDEDNEANNLKQFRKLVFFCETPLRLLRIYILEIYPESSKRKQCLVQDETIDRSIAKVFDLLSKILSDPLVNNQYNEKCVVKRRGVEKIAQEAHKAYVECYYAFHPIASLRWFNLCKVLSEYKQTPEKLLNAVLAAMCIQSLKLCTSFSSSLTTEQNASSEKTPTSETSSDSRSTSPSTSSCSTTANQPILDAMSPSDINPIELRFKQSDQILSKRKLNYITTTTWHYKIVLNKLLDIVLQNVNDAIQNQIVPLHTLSISESKLYNESLTTNCCDLIIRLIGELAMQAIGVNEEIEGSCGRVMYTTQSRYTRCNQCRSWNTGNGSPDAICFSVDRPGISIAGVCVYGGTGTYEYELELLDDQNSAGQDPSQSQRWNSLEVVKGSYSSDESPGEVTELKFEKAVPIRENVKYAIRLRNHGGKTSNGDGGMSCIRGPDGTTFTFSTCSLSFNGTTQTRGQIPQILYYSSPKDCENEQNIRLLAEAQARKCTIELAGVVIKRCASLFASVKDEDIKILKHSVVVTHLLPKLITKVQTVAFLDASSAVQVLALVHEILPTITKLNLSEMKNGNEIPDLCTTSNHYACVESEHPYKSAGACYWDVNFPENVKCMTIEFDPQCGTAQPEDTLQIYLPLPNQAEKSGGAAELIKRGLMLPLAEKYSGNKNWPQVALVLPGNRVYFSLETASDYVQDDRSNYYGFKCQVIGYDWDAIATLKSLECSIAYLAGECVHSLAKKKLQLPPIPGEQIDEDMEAIEEIANQVYIQNSTLLGKGFALAHPPSIQQALDGVLPFSSQSIEKQFLKDFVDGAIGTSGGRLARWLQPGSYVDPKRCEVLYSKDDMKCGWPAIVTILSKDQYGDLVHASGLKIDVKAVPIEKGDVGEGSESKRSSRVMSEPNACTFGGHPMPSLTVPYETTVRDKMCYHSITIMKPYENYSFEELRLTSPTIRRSSENMLVKQNADGSYSATWTPGSVGWYSILVTVDGYSMEQRYQVEVKEAPIGIAPPVPAVVKETPSQPSNLRVYAEQNSAGLRIRTHPSLQSEQIGVVPLTGVISFTDQVHNDDGIWLRLSGESVRQMCSSGHPEAWCLEYHQHFKRALLAPYEKDKPAVEEAAAAKEPTPKKMLTQSDTNKKRNDGPGLYQVVRCGASGHNIRSRPSLSAPPLGMLVLGNHVMVVDDCINEEGVWVKLDAESRKEFCFNGEGEAWSLAMSRNHTIYLQNEGDPDKDVRGKKKGYQFKTPPPALSDSKKSAFNFGASNVSSPAIKQPFLFGVPQAEKLHPQEESQQGNEENSAPTTERKRFSSAHSVPERAVLPELKGVCVKELVKAMGELRSNGNAATPPGTPRRSASPKASGPIATSSPKGATGPIATSCPIPISSPVKGLKMQSSAGSSPEPRSVIGISSLVNTDRRSSTQSDTSALVSSITKDLSRSPSNSSLQLRSESPHSSITSQQEIAMDIGSTSPRLTQTGTQTSPEDTNLEYRNNLKTLASRVGKKGRQMAVKSNYKLGRRDRGKSDATNRELDRERPHSSKDHHRSASGKHHTRGTSPANPIQLKDNVKNGLTPSVAECLRAVFAAFLWHEGLVHDAMACASFLKFHPSLPKEGARVITRPQSSLQQEDKIKQRHSVEVSASNYLHVQPSTLETLMMSAANANANRSRANKKVLTKQDENAQTVTVLPPALRSLVVLWEELGVGSLHAIQFSLVSPPSPIQRQESKEIPSTSQEKRNRRKKEVPLRLDQRLNKIAMGNMKDNNKDNKDSICELCGETFPHPVTFHMKAAHPGCGQSAGGKGYNSGGNFCVGWAGNCGDGGVGGSTWYLICDSCRYRYIRQRKVGTFKKKKKLTVGSNSKLLNPSTTSVDAHLIMKENAMFLLELESAASKEPLPCSPPLRKSPLMPSLNENYLDDGPFSCHLGPADFNCLTTLGVDTSEARKLSEEQILAETLKQNGEQGLDKFLEGVDLNQANDNVQEGTLSDSEDGQRGRPFHRSISMTGNGKGGLAAERAGNRVSSVVMRKRNNSSGEGLSDTTSAGTSSLLCNPSAALQKLIPPELSRTVYSAEADNGTKPLNDFMGRPVIQFILRPHNLPILRFAMNQAIRKSACRVYAFKALTWLIRNVTQCMAIHDVLWFFEFALSQIQNKDDQQFDGDDELEHPLTGLAVAGEAVRPLPSAFHACLQSIADLMLFLPPGSALQTMAIKCWSIKFSQADHAFLHRSHVFSNISKILSRSEEQDNIEGSAQSFPSIHKPSGAFIDCPYNIISLADIRASSRQAMVENLRDNSTETFWESSEEDRNKSKVITITLPFNCRVQMVYIHVDNCRDIANKVSNLIVQAGPNIEELYKFHQTELEGRYSGWISAKITKDNFTTIRLELRGPDNSLRLRQLAVLGFEEGNSHIIPCEYSAVLLQQKMCEAETLRVFRMITSQVFGKLLAGPAGQESEQEEIEPAVAPSDTAEENELREHVVGILFSRSKLTHLQKMVCTHIVDAIRHETAKEREEWETSLCSAQSQSDIDKISDTYCFEMLSMVLALSGSTVGRAYLAQQNTLIKNIFSLLHIGSARVQRQIALLLKRMLPEITPQTVAQVMKIDHLPPMDFSIVSASKYHNQEPPLDMNKAGILDVLFSVIAKALNLQVRVKGGSRSESKAASTAVLATSVHPKTPLGQRWWLRGTISRRLAEEIIVLLKDMISGKLGDAWAEATKGAVAENILNLTRLPEENRTPSDCMATPVLWLSLASLCVLDAEHVERLSSAQWTQPDGQPRPTCTNHDDGETAAIIQCNVCSSLCAECDRVLHLHKRTRLHHRQVCKEEEEAIKVDLHEGCGRTKLFWLLALADSKTLKALVEFRERGTTIKAPGTISAGVCRFCGATGSTGLLAIGNVCAEQECQEHAKNACSKLHNCGHMCGGIQGENPCLPCLHGCSMSATLKQDADDMCMICFIDALSCAPAIQLKCGHVFHLHCCRNVLTKRWAGPRITFSFAQCPICKSPIWHSELSLLLAPIEELLEDVQRKSLMRLEYEGLLTSEAITSQGARFFNNAAGYAMERYAYYVCFRCKKAYYGGEARCDVEAGNFNPEELVCGACSDVSRAQMCPKHGTDFLEYKCRYCCSVAVFFCFGTTHFCNPCHDDFQRVTNILKHELPKCPAGPRAKQLDGEECPLHIKHPATGEEFALGCGVCRNAHTF